MNTEFEFEALEGAKNYRKWIREIFSDHLHGTAVEVGAGIGQNTAEYLSETKIKELICIEPDAVFADRLRQKCPSVQVIEGTIKNLPKCTDPQTIISINVLEHIKDDLEELREYSKRLSKRNGTLCLLVPARMELYSDIDKIFGHHKRYCKAGLKSLLQDAGFTKINIQYINIIGYITWLINFRLLSQKRFGKWSVKAFDSMLIPPFKTLEKLLKPPIGQSLVVIANPYQNPPHAHQEDKQR